MVSNLEYNADGVRHRYARARWEAPRVRRQGVMAHPGHGIANKIGPVDQGELGPPASHGPQAVEVGEGR